MHKFHENLRHHYGDIYRLRNASSPRHVKFYVGLNKFLETFSAFWKENLGTKLQDLFNKTFFRLGAKIRQVWGFFEYIFSYARFMEKIASSTGWGDFCRNLLTFVSQIIMSKAVFRIRIRIHRIHMFVDLPDPDPYPLVRSMVRILLSSFYHQAKIIRKTLIPTVCDFFWTFYLRK
jgi:hypothetical protein